MLIRFHMIDIRYLAVFATGVFLMALIIGWNGQPTEPKFPSPGPPALILLPGPATGAPDLSVWIQDGWRAPIDYDEATLEINICWANRSTGDGVILRHRPDLGWETGLSLGEASLGPRLRKYRGTQPE